MVGENESYETDEKTSRKWREHSTDQNSSDEIIWVVDSKVGDIVYQNRKIVQLMTYRISY